MQCEMCGNDTSLVDVKIEGTSMQVCKECAKYGQILAPPKKEKLIIKKPKSKVQEVDSDLYVVGDFAKIIRKKRESLNLKQNEFALKINEKESLVQAIENDKMTPSIKLAAKLEKMLGIKLIEQEKKVTFTGVSSGSSGGLTMADFIKKGD